MKPISVDCIIAPDGRVNVRRIEIDGQWQTVGQGRQWTDEEGRHVLVMLHGQQVQEIVFRPGQMNWILQLSGRVSQAV